MHPWKTLNFQVIRGCSLYYTVTEWVRENTTFRGVCLKAGENIPLNAETLSLQRYRFSNHPFLRLDLAYLMC